MCVCVQTHCRIVRGSHDLQPIFLRAPIQVDMPSLHALFDKVIDVLVDDTNPRPKSLSHTRFTNTLAVSGLSFEVSQAANSLRPLPEIFGRGP